MGAVGAKALAEALRASDTMHSAKIDSIKNLFVGSIKIQYVWMSEVFIQRLFLANETADGSTCITPSLFLLALEVVGVIQTSATVE